MSSWRTFKLFILLILVSVFFYALSLVGSRLKTSQPGVEARYFDQGGKTDPFLPAKILHGKDEERGTRIEDNDLNLEIDQEDWSNDELELVTSGVRSDGENQCVSPMRHFMLLKNHKTGSSTMFNILSRYGAKHDIIFTVPRVGIFLGWPNGFKPSQTIKLKKGSFESMVHHTRFDAAAVGAVLPSDTVYMGLMRHPVAGFESRWSYFQLAGSVGLQNDPSPMETFLRNPKKYYDTRRDDIYLKNLLFYEYGFESRSPSPEYVENAIKIIENQFNLIIISEYFDESLILVKELLCMEMEDLVYLKINVRSNSSRKSIQDEEMKKLILEWNSADTRLYEHFNRTLWQKIDLYGRERMAQDVAALHDKMATMTAHCTEAHTANSNITNKKLKVAAPVAMMSYNLSPEGSRDPLCVMMAQPEREFSDYFRQKYRNTGIA